MEHDIFGFLDETGLLHNPRDRFFGMGLLVAPQLALLHRRLIALRNGQHYFGEFKFSSVNPQNLRLYMGLVDVFFATQGARFSAAIYDKETAGFLRQFGKHYDAAYNAIAGELVKGSLLSGERVALLADDLSTGKQDDFELAIRKRAGGCVFGVCRISSEAALEIQLTDVLLGAAMYFYRVKRGEVMTSAGVAKLELAKYVQKRFGFSLDSETTDRDVPEGARFAVSRY